MISDHAIERLKSTLPLELIKQVALAHGFKPEFLTAIVIGESGGDRFAVRYEPLYRWVYKVKEHADDNRVTETTERMLQMTSWGLCQVMGAVARELGIRGPMFGMLDPAVNLKVAAKLLQRLKNKYDRNEDLYSAYNAGSVIKTAQGEYVNQLYVSKAMSLMRATERFFKEP